MLNSCLLIQTVQSIKSKQKMFMKIFIKTNLFDFSDYPLDSKFFDPGNKKVLAK